MSSVSHFEYNPLDKRATAFPIGRPQMYKYYTDARTSFWSPEEIEVTDDGAHFRNRLSTGEKRFVKYILAFFAPSDGLVNVNLAERFKVEVGIKEAEYFYNFQVAMEDIHAEVYSKLLDAIVEDSTERDRLIDSVNTIPVVGKIADWINSCVVSDASFAERLLRMACIEGILFQSCFCAIYWFKERGLMPGLAHSNELIARDEALHTMFALYLYTQLLPQCQLESVEVKKIFVEAVDLAVEFINDALPAGMTEMNVDLMKSYIENTADNLVTLIDLPVIYGSTHGFTFMDKINYTNRTNFFERRVSEYSKVSISDDGTIQTDF